MMWACGPAAAVLQAAAGSTGCWLRGGCSITLQWGGCPALAQAPFRGTTFHPARGPHAGSHATPHGRHADLGGAFDGGRSEAVGSMGWGG
eukprot:COSAG01_NODE_2382_length_7770_cov_4.692318_8_plen_90_part_00